MINSFSQFLVEEEREIYFAFGRMNPPTVGHGKLLDALAAKSGKNPYKVFLCQSHDKNKNPLSYTDKIKHARKMFPKHARSIMVNKKVKTPMDALVALYDEGYVNVTMIAGSDRLREFDVLLNKYNGQKGRHGFYNFKSIKIISAGARDPDAEGVEGMSASKQRENVKKNDYSAFSQGLPNNMPHRDAKALFNSVRKGMGLKEQNEFKRHIQLKTVSETREAFIKGSLFETGEEVIIKETNQIGTITVLGSNYLIIETKDGKTRQWLDAVEKIEEAYQHDEGTPAATKKAKAMTPGQNERKLSDKELKDREKYAQDLPDDDFKKRYGKDWKSVKIATATKMAKAKNEDACWDSHKQVGMKKKGNRMVPNCVPKEQQDSEIADRPGSQPKKYHVGLSKAQKIRRDRQFKKQAKMSDSDPKAYKPAPGDAKAKTKLSKHTLKYRQMYGDD